MDLVEICGTLLAQTTKQAGVRFLVMFVYATDDEKADYQKMLNDQKIKHIDCRHLPYQKKELLAWDNAHPHPITHRFWAECLKKGLATNL